MEYSISQISEKVLMAIENAGIPLPELEDGDINLAEYIEDSIQFVSMIVNIEEELGLTLPDDFLIIDNFHSFTGLINLIKELTEVSK